MRNSGNHKRPPALHYQPIISKHRSPSPSSPSQAQHSSSTVPAQPSPIHARTKEDDYTKLSRTTSVKQHRGINSLLRLFSRQCARNTHSHYLLPAFPLLVLPALLPTASPSPTFVYSPLAPPLPNHIDILTPAVFPSRAKKSYARDAGPERPYTVSWI